MLPPIAPLVLAATLLLLTITTNDAGVVSVAFVSSDTAGDDDSKNKPSDSGSNADAAADDEMSKWKSNLQTMMTDLLPKIAAQGNDEVFLANKI